MLECCSFVNAGLSTPPPCVRHAAVLLHRLEQTHAALATMTRNLPTVPEAVDVLASYELATAAVQQFITNTHNTWFTSVDPNVARQLNVSLLLQDRSAGGSWAFAGEEFACGHLCL